MTPLISIWLPLKIRLAVRLVSRRAGTYNAPRRQQ
jgi:hypothetical protein